MGCVSGSTNIGPLERTVELNQAESTVNLRFPLWCPAPALGCKGLCITEIASLVVVVVFNVCRFIQHRIHICRGRTLASKWQLQHNLTFSRKCVLASEVIKKFTILCNIFLLVLTFLASKPLVLPVLPLPSILNTIITPLAPSALWTPLAHPL